MKYRRRTSISPLEAIQWTGTNRVEVARFIKGDALSIDDPLLLHGKWVFMEIPSGGYKKAKPTDWIIKDKLGCYPEDNKEFQTYYEPYWSPEVLALAEFARWSLRYSYDFEHVQDKAKNLGLLQQTEYNPEIHGEDDFAQKGDPWYLWADWLKEMKA